MWLQADTRAQHTTKPTWHDTKGQAYPRQLHLARQLQTTGSQKERALRATAIILLILSSQLMINLKSTQGHRVRSMYLNINMGSGAND